MSDVWIRTEPTMDGSGYMVTLSVGEDAIVHLDPERAFAHARTVMGYVFRADHDAAIVKQMSKVLKGSQKTQQDEMLAIAELIRDIRADRPPLDDEATAPLRFASGVNQSKKGFLEVWYGDEQLGTWSTKAAMKHAVFVMGAVEGANLDAAYKRALVGLVGIDPARAENIVDDLGKYNHAGGLNN